MPTQHFRAHVTQPVSLAASLITSSGHDNDDDENDAVWYQNLPVHDKQSKAAVHSGSFSPSPL